MEEQRRMGYLGIKDNKILLYTYKKDHKEIYYFIQLINANKMKIFLKSCNNSLKMHIE